MHLIASEELLYSAPEDIVKLAFCCVVLILDKLSASRTLAQLPYVEALQEQPASTLY